MILAPFRPIHLSRPMYRAMPALNDKTRSIPSPATASLTASPLLPEQAQSHAAIVWFRVGDLRLTDHEPLHTALHSLSPLPSALVPVFCLDDHLLHPFPQLDAARPRVDDDDTPLGLPYYGPHRLILLLQALKSLQHSLQRLESTLVVASGSTGELMSRLAQHLVSSGYHRLSLHYYSCKGPHAAVVPIAQTTEEEAILAFQQAARNAGAVATEVHPCVWGGTLYHPDDIDQALGLSSAQRTPGSMAKNDIRAGDVANNAVAANHSLGGNSTRAEHDAAGYAQLLAKSPHMTAFRSELQRRVRARKPLPGPPPPAGTGSTSMPPLPRGHSLYSRLLNDTTTHATTTCTHTNKDEDAEAASGDADVAGTAPRGRRLGLLDVMHTPLDKSFVVQIYEDAGAGGALAGLERLVGDALAPRLYGRLEDPQGREVRRFPVTEKEALRHLHALLLYSNQPEDRQGQERASEVRNASEPSSHASKASNPVGSRGTQQRMDVNMNMGVSKRLFMVGYRESRMLAGGESNSAMLSVALSLGTLSPRTVYWNVLEAMMVVMMTMQPQALAAMEGGGGTAGAGGDLVREPGESDGRLSRGIVTSDFVFEKPKQEEGDLYERYSHPRIRDAAKHAAAAWPWEDPTPSSAGHHHLLMHLGIRDYFLFSAARDGQGLLRIEGPRGNASKTSNTSNDKFKEKCGTKTWNRDRISLERWCRGLTGFPFIDAGMRELACTGWMDNRCRQNAASFLAKALECDWRLGAEVFQCLLVDSSDVAINWGNWAYVAGVGADPRDRTFMLVTQGERYDKNAEFISLWCPELGELPVQTRHRPWEATEHEMRAAKLRLRGVARSQDSSEGGGCRCNDDETSQSASDASVEYPAPMIDPAKQIGKRGKIA